MAAGPAGVHGLKDSKFSPKYIATFPSEIEAEKCAGSLYAYVRAAWHLVEPQTSFMDNWHIGLICEYLQAVTDLEIHNLIINVPPRHMKSLLVSVFWPTWSWINTPHLRWLTGSYATPLAVRDALKSRRILQSGWYQRRFGGLFKLCGDQNLKGRYENDRSGYRLAFSFSSAVTGEGGDVLVVDMFGKIKDGTFAGDGPGPRAMRWHEKNIMLASADQVAIDAVSAKLQGFDPMSIPFIRMAHELGLGVGDPREIEIVGYDINQEQPWNFVQEDTFASRGQKMIYHGPLKPFEKLLLQSPIVPWSFFASNFYHNVYWYPFVGRKRVQEALKTPWGQLFASYGDGRVAMPGVEPRTVVQAAAGMSALAVVAGGLLWFLSRNGKKKN